MKIPLVGQLIIKTLTAGNEIARKRKGKDTLVEVHHGAGGRKDSMSKPWAIMGDFNCVSASNERVNCQNSMAYVGDNALDDAPSTVLFFTWQRREKWAKLDKFLLNRDWADSGLDCRAAFMDLTIESDHCPIVLSLFGPSPSGSKPFKIFNMWTPRDDFGEIVRRVWEGPLKALKSKVFGHISIKATKANDKYKSLMKLLVDDPSNPSLIDMNSKKTEATFLIDAKRSFSKRQNVTSLLTVTRAHATSMPMSRTRLVMLSPSWFLPREWPPLRPSFVDPAQSAFVEGRSLVDNIFLTQQLVKGYAVKRTSPRCMLKVDITKAFDTVSWQFLGSVLIGLGFPRQFVSLIMECVTTTSFSLSLKNCLHGFLKA
ncbi:unnamed protein product [Cuscuta campestris]|uniref:Uncharacterized protein n=1 Tax=Cuscuta campestris TaxID=132261 RepID=A0A484KPG5_9ASTE|nr:unnamed protein product [Cuscuta campestris]